MTNATNGTLRAANRRAATSPRSTIGITPVTTTPERRDPLERELRRAARADHVVDEQHPGARLEPGALDPLFTAALLLFLAHREPRLAGHHRHAVRERVGAHRETTDRVELDAVERRRGRRPPG